MTEPQDPDDQLDDEWGGDPETGEARRASLTSVLGIACAALTLSGIVLFSAAAPRVFDPEGSVCGVARTSIDDANDDDADYNDVTIDGDLVESADDLSCDQAVDLAESIPRSEDGDDTLALASPGAMRLWGVVAALLGLLQVVGGVGTMMTLSAAFRRVAVTSSVVGILVPVFGFLSLVVVIFVVWSLMFSRQAKDTWGPLRWAGGSRRSRSE